MAEELPKWEGLAALAAECAARFDRLGTVLSKVKAGEARQLRADFLWAATDPIRAKRGIVETWTGQLQALMQEVGLAPKPRDEADPDPTPRCSGTLQRAPDLAHSARVMCAKLDRLRGSTLLARDRCGTAAASAELSARILEAEDLIAELADIARQLDSWQQFDPGPEVRPLVVHRWAQTERRAYLLLGAVDVPSGSPSASPQAIEVVEPRKDRWPH